MQDAGYRMRNAEVRSQKSANRMQDAGFMIHDARLKAILLRISDSHIE
jgi:hypothetical protein